MDDAVFVSIPYTLRDVVQKQMQAGKSMGIANLLEGVRGSKSSGISGSSVSQPHPTMLVSPEVPCAVELGISTTVRDIIIRNQININDRIVVLL